MGRVNKAPPSSKLGTIEKAPDQGEECTDANANRLAALLGPGYGNKNEDRASRLLY